MDIGDMTDAQTTYTRGWDRAFDRVAADLAVERAAARPEAPDLLTFGEAAKHLKVTDRTVRNLIDRGELTRVDIPGVKGAPRVEAAEVAALIERGRGSR